MSKKNKEDLSSLISKAKKKDVKTVIQKVVAKTKPNAEKKYNFSFVLTKSQIEELREFVNNKRKNVECFSYSNTDAFREGLNLLKNENKDFNKRPEKLKLSTRIGRRFGAKNGKETFPTSFSITYEQREFIYDYIYHKSIDNDKYSKSEFFSEILGMLNKVTKK